MILVVAALYIIFKQKIVGYGMSIVMGAVIIFAAIKIIKFMLSGFGGRQSRQKLYKKMEEYEEHEYYKRKNRQ